MSGSISAADILVEGRVQGVGYRAFAHRRAAMLGLVGYVRNCDDGSVFVHAEGDDAVIDEFVRQLEQGPRLARVACVTAARVPPTGHFSSFVIRHAEVEP
jgi:acylphosphatase